MGVFDLALGANHVDGPLIVRRHDHIAAQAAATALGGSHQLLQLPLRGARGWRAFGQGSGAAAAARWTAFNGGDETKVTLMDKDGQRDLGHGETVKVTTTTDGEDVTQEPAPAPRAPPAGSAEPPANTAAKDSVITIKDEGGWKDIRNGKKHAIRIADDSTATVTLATDAREDTQEVLPGDSVSIDKAGRMTKTEGAAKQLQATHDDEKRDSGAHEKEPAHATHDDEEREERSPRAAPAAPAEPHAKTAAEDPVRTIEDEGGRKDIHNGDRDSGAQEEEPAHTHDDEERSPRAAPAAPAEPHAKTAAEDPVGTIEDESGRKDIHNGDRDSGAQEEEPMLDTLGKEAKEPHKEQEPQVRKDLAAARPERPVKGDEHFDEMMEGRQKSTKGQDGLKKHDNTFVTPEGKQWHPFFTNGAWGHLMGDEHFDEMMEGHQECTKECCTVGPADKELHAGVMGALGGPIVPPDFFKMRVKMSKIPKHRVTIELPDGSLRPSLPLIVENGNGIDNRTVRSLATYMDKLMSVSAMLKKLSTQPAESPDAELVNETDKSAFLAVWGSGKLAGGGGSGEAWSSFFPRCA